MMYLLGFGYVWAENDDETLKHRFLLSLFWPIIAGLVCFCYLLYVFISVALFFTTCEECQTDARET